MGDPGHRGGAVSGGDVTSLASALGPVLIEQAGGRLSEIEWFRSTWQRGGAATGFAHWRGDDGPIDAMVKLPVGPVEHRWTTALGRCAEWAAPASVAIPTPRVLASGRSVGGYDLAWLVVERLDGHTLASNWTRGHAVELLRAAAHMQALAAREAPLDAAPERPDWDAIITRGREAIRDAHLPESQRWNEALKRAHRAVGKLVARWEARPINTWCHGDLHPGNAMHRVGGNGSPGPCVLIDLALVHPGHWIEDAVYLERQFWGRPDQLHDVHPVSELASARRALGLSTDGDYGALANIRRVLMAACVPAFLAREGHPKYVHAALEILERLLPQVAH